MESMAVQLKYPVTQGPPEHRRGLANRRWVRLGLSVLAILCLLFWGAILIRTSGKLGSLKQIQSEYFPRDDFVALYSGGALMRDGRGAAVYTLTTLSVAERRATGSRLPADFSMPFFYPPYALLPLAPLARLPIAMAGQIWIVATAALFTAGLALVLATYRRRIGVLAAALGILGIVSSNPVFHVVELGQWSFLLGAGVCLLFVGLRRPHPAYPILGLLLLSPKPQLLFLPLLFLLFQRRFRVLVGFVAMTALLTLVTMAFTAPHILFDWLRLTAQASLWDNQYTISSFHQFGWVGLIGGLLGPGHAALRRLLVTALDAATIAGLGLFIYRGRRLGRSESTLFAVAIAGALLASANLNPQEMILLIPTLLVLYQSPEFKRGSVVLFALAGWVATWVFLIMLNATFDVVWPSMAFVRDPHANPFMLALSYLNVGTLYLLALVCWLLRRVMKAEAVELSPSRVSGNANISRVPLGGGGATRSHFSLLDGKG